MSAAQILLQGQRFGIFCQDLSASVLVVNYLMVPLQSPHFTNPLYCTTRLLKQFPMGVTRRCDFRNRPVIWLNQYDGRAELLFEANETCAPISQADEHVKTHSGVSAEQRSPAGCELQDVTRCN